MSLQFLQFLQMQGSGKAGFQHPFQCQSCMNSSIKFWCQILSEEGYLLENLLTFSKGKFWKGLGMFRFKKINFTLTKNLEIITRVIYNLWGTLGGLDGKESACRAGDLDLIPGLGRSPGEGNGNPLQYSCLENPMDREAWTAKVHGVDKELDSAVKSQSLAKAPTLSGDGC